MRTLDDLDVEGKRVLVRVDFNVPLDEDRKITDDARIQARAADAEGAAREGRARLVLLAHLGRPKGRDAEVLAQARRGPARRAARRRRRARARPRRRARRRRRDGRERALLRGRDQERRGAGRALRGAGRRLRQRRVRRRAPRARLHRGASRTCCRRAAGRLLEREVTTLNGILEDPKRPLVAVVGGAKVTDKIGVLEAFLEQRRHGPDRRRDVLPVLQGPGPRRRRLAVRGGGRRARVAR